MKTSKNITFKNIKPSKDLILFYDDYFTNLLSKYSNKLNKVYDIFVSPNNGYQFHNLDDFNENIFHDDSIGYFELSFHFKINDDRELYSNDIIYLSCRSNDLYIAVTTNNKLVTDELMKKITDDSRILSKKTKPSQRETPEKENIDNYKVEEVYHKVSDEVVWWKSEIFHRIAGTVLAAIAIIIGIIQLT